MFRAAPVKPDLIASITSFGDLLRYLRQRSQLTQRDLALANLLVGRWTTGRGELAKAINCLLAALLWFETKQLLYFLYRTYFYLADAFVLAGKSEQAMHYYRYGLPCNSILSRIGGRKHSVNHCSRRPTPNCAIQPTPRPGPRAKPCRSIRRCNWR